MKKAATLYCVTLGYITGASVSEIKSYKVTDHGYAFKAPFTPVTFVKASDLYQPVSKNGQTYIFGFVPGKVLAIASVVHQDLLEGLKAEQNWITMTTSKIKSSWSKTARALQEADREPGAEPEPPKTKTPEPVTEGTVHMDAVSQPVAQEVEEAKPERRLEEYTLTFYAALSQDKSKFAYCTIIESNLLPRPVRISSVCPANPAIHMDLVAILSGLQCNKIPRSSVQAQTRLTIQTTNKFVARFVNSRSLYTLPESGWKNPDGSDVRYRHLWEDISTYTRHMTVQAVLKDQNDKTMQVCRDHALSQL